MSPIMQRLQDMMDQEALAEVRMENPDMEPELELETLALREFGWLY